MKIGLRILLLTQKSLWLAVGFHSLTNNLVQLHFLQSFVPVDHFNVFSISLNGFPATVRVPTKSWIGGMTYSRAVEEKRVTGSHCSQAADLWGGGGEAETKVAGDRGRSN
jgi:hypothetical protein